MLTLGIIGTGRIARRMVAEARVCDGLELAAVYNPHVDSARQFADEFALTAVDNLAALLTAVDAVYIAAPHAAHAEYVRLALTADCHALCEKPLALNEHDAKDVFALAQRRGLVLMEALKTLYAPGFRRLLQQVRGGAIGEVRDVEAAFTKLLPTTDCRELAEVDVGGAFTELGSYALLPIFELLGGEYGGVDFDTLDLDSGVDIYSKARLRYPAALATAKVGLRVKSEGQLLISGTRGYLLAPSPWWLTRRWQLCRENPRDNQAFTAPFEGDGLRYELAEFARRVAGEPYDRARERDRVTFAAKLMGELLRRRQSCNVKR